MIAFLTGSQVYGTPRPDSDVDLVIQVSGEDFAILNQLCDGTGASSQSIRFGKLNLIILPSDKKFAAWQKATDALKARKPVTREQAVKEITAAMEATEPVAA